MKKYQKFILPTLLVILLVLIYSVYFSKSNVLGSFGDFDPNNSAVKDIRVKLVVERGITQQGNDVVFYVADKNGKVMIVNGSVTLPQGIEQAEAIILKGHLSGNSFHTHDVILD